MHYIYQHRLTHDPAREDLQDSKTEHADDGALHSPIELHIPQQEDWQDSKNPIADDRDDSDRV